MPLTDKILSFDISSPNSKAQAIAERVKQRGLELNPTQEDLSVKAEIPFATYRRFERIGKFSLEGFSISPTPLMLRNYKNTEKEDAVQLAVKFGLKQDEAEEVFEEIVKHIK